MTTIFKRHLECKECKSKTDHTETNAPGWWQCDDCGHECMPPQVPGRIIPPGLADDYPDSPDSPEEKTETRPAWRQARIDEAETAMLALTIFDVRELDAAEISNLQDAAQHVLRLCKKVSARLQTLETPFN